MKINDIMELLEHLQRKNPTQYYTLIKMHLSFITDVSLDQCDGSFDNSSANSGKWNLSPLLKKFLKSNHNQRSNDTLELSSPVMKNIFSLMELLKRNENITQEGLFRKTGSVSRQNELKSAIQSQENYKIDSSIYNAHDCASVLKSFLADLPDPILQESQYHVHCRILEMCQNNSAIGRQTVSNCHQLKALSLVFLLLPFDNYVLLRELLLLLHKVTLHQDKNKMSSSNLGTMFAPHILCPRKMSANELQFRSGSLSTTVAFIIENARQLFEIPSELVLDVREYFRAEEAMQRQISKKSLEEAPTKTLFTFVDRELTNEANKENVTETALAELYAYVQSLPNSSQKRKLISKFNEASGQGTPKCNHSLLHKTDQRAKSFGDSLKKHLFTCSVRKAKTKNPLTKVLNLTRSNSDDLLSTSSVSCSPELESEKSPKAKAKSMDNLLSPKLSSNNVESPSHSGWKKHKKKILAMTPSLPDSLPSSSPTFTSTPMVKHFLNEKFGSFRSHRISQTSRENTPSKNSPANNKNSFNSSNVLSISPVKKLLATQDYSENCSSPHRSFDSSVIVGNNGNESNKITSPITHALRKSNSQQKLMMTPRSRRPLILNSTSNISSVPIPEENGGHLKKTTIFSSENESEVDKVDGEEIISRGESRELQKRIGNEKDSLYSSIEEKINIFSRERFIGFYNRLSTSSLLKIASHLSSSSFSGPEINSPSCSNCHETSHNETLTTVFKEYLLNRSILVENPVDLSSDDILSYSGYEQSSNSNISGSDEQSNSTDLKDFFNANSSLSKSLLFCLDGNNPTHVSSTPKRLSFSSDGSPYSVTKRTRVTEENNGSISQTSDIGFVEKSESSLKENNLSSQPNLRSSSGRKLSGLKNKNGTPFPEKRIVRKKRKESTVLFETKL